MNAIPSRERKKGKIWLAIRNYSFIVFGLFLFAFGWTVFLIPSELTGGGVAGVATLVYYATKIPVGISTLILNGILVIISFKILGPRFCIVTIGCTLVLSFFFDGIQYLVDSYPQFFTELNQDIFMCSVIGGVLAALGVGIVLTYGGNTGGTDIIVLMIGKYRNIAYGRMSLQINIFIVALSFLVFRDIKLLIYSYIALVVYNLTSDLVLGGYQQSLQLMIFSKKSVSIADRISKEINRGVTVMKGYGWYSKIEQDVLVVILHRTEKFRAMQIIKEEDPDAFISVSKVQGVFGKNFDELKITPKKRKK
ncbi:MAG: YitT family protein [Bacteroidales bacterium]|jgi:uncharacterized membrane-anchored protein YitT (DUF2179 family)|nr:YitT family protein [Bacteroidales bacterium]